MNVPGLASTSSFPGGGYPAARERFDKGGKALDHGDHHYDFYGMSREIRAMHCAPWFVLCVFLKKYPPSIARQRPVKVDLYHNAFCDYTIQFSYRARRREVPGTTLCGT